MKNFIYQLQQKPEHVRKQIAVVSTLSIFGLIFSVWWNVWSINANENTPTDISPIAAITAPFQTVKEQMKDTLPSAIADVRTQLTAAALVSSSTSEEIASADADEQGYPEYSYEPGIAAPDTGETSGEAASF